MNSQERYALLAALMPLTDPCMNQGDTRSDTEIRALFGQKLCYALSLKREANHTHMTKRGPQTEMGIARLVLDLLVETLVGDNEEV